jgi:hypothetical protein
MPNGGAVSRSRQLAMLRRLAHEHFVDPTLGRLMDQLEPRVDKLSADDVSLLRVVRRDYEKAIKVPAEYVARANAHCSRSYNAWTRARPANDFAAMIPFLKKTLDLSREYASFARTIGSSSRRSSSKRRWIVAVVSPSSASSIIGSAMWAARRRLSASLVRRSGATPPQFYKAWQNRVEIVTRISFQQSLADQRVDFCFA